MKLWTYGEASTKIKSDLGMEDELFITPDEMAGYFNEAIDEAEAEILKIHEDYFLNKFLVPLVVTEAEIELPTDMYGQKIRAVTFNDGSRQYNVHRIRGSQKFIDIASTNQFDQAADYRYFLLNGVAGEQAKMQITPPARETDTGKMVMWYIRNAQRVPMLGEDIGTVDTPIIVTEGIRDAIILDIPEFTSFLLQFVKVRCYEKDGDPRTELAVTALQNQRKMMVDTLTQQVPDDDDTVEMDLSHYRDHT